MARRTPADVYAALIQVGFSPDAATTMTAIAGAESGYDTTAVGDTGIQTAQWGPSYGLFQVRTIRTDTGTGRTRDIASLSTGDTAQARAAYAISNGGKDFSAWTTYTSGKYQSFLPAAQSVAAGDTGPFPTWGPSWLPWNWPSNAANAAQASALGGARSILVEAVFVVAGLGLVAGGVYLVAKPGKYIGAAAKLAGKVL